MARFPRSIGPAGGEPGDSDDTFESDAQLAPVAFLFGGPQASAPGTSSQLPELDVSGLTPQQVEEQQSQLRDLENIVVRALARKDLSEYEVTRILEANGVEASSVEALLAIYRSKGYVDDYAFAEREIERLHRRKGFGRSQIQRELASKHVSQEIVSDLLSSLDDDDELARALELAEKKAPSLLRLDRATAERRLSSFLQRKGYPSQVVRDAVSKTLVAGTSTVRFR